MSIISKNTAHLFLRGDHIRKDGKQHICIRLKISGRKKDIGTREYCPVQYWDKQKQQVKRSYPESERINQTIENLILQADKIILRYKNNHQPLTIEEFEADFGFEKTTSFIDFVEREIKQEKRIRSKSEGTISGYGKDLSKLKRYLGRDLLFSEITKTFLENYEANMRNELKNCTNTIHRSNKFIRTFLNRAIAQGIKTPYPFDKYKLKKEETHRHFFVEAELRKVHEYFISLPENHKFKATLKPFLFCCYTGIRFTDVSLLSYQDIHNGFVSIKMHKTKDIISIPLFDKAKDLIKKGFIDTQHVFKVPVNQTVNRHLKDICKTLGINKKISFHCSRHTFATFALSNGMQSEVIQKLLGHREIKTTQIYARLIDKTVNENMERLNAQLNNAFAEKNIKVII
ncbi:MAG TPA: site-specific integrase [Bacteroidia bacterium]